MLAASPQSYPAVKHEAKDGLTMANQSAARISRYMGRTKTQANTGSGDTQTYPRDPLCSPASDSDNSSFEEPIGVQQTLRPPAHNFSMGSARYLNAHDSSSSNINIGRNVSGIIGMQYKESKFINASDSSIMEALPHRMNGKQSASKSMGKFTHQVSNIKMPQRNEQASKELHDALRESALETNKYKTARGENSQSKRSFMQPRTEQFVGQMNDALSRTTNLGRHEPEQDEEDPVVDYEYMSAQKESRRL